MSNIKTGDTVYCMCEFCRGNAVCKVVSVKPHSGLAIVMPDDGIEQTAFIKDLFHDKDSPEAILRLSKLKG